MQTEIEPKKPSYVFRSGSLTLEFDTQDGVFMPNLTSVTVISGVTKVLEGKKRVLDMGCGCGVIGISLAAMGFVDETLSASDLSPEAVELTIRNAKKLGVRIEGRTGSLLEPWRGEKFDCIIDEVPSISEEVARLSPWFRNIPCFSGDDGTKLRLEVLQTASEFLQPGGVLVFPLISLTNKATVLLKARELYDVEVIAQTRFPLPPEMMAHKEALLKLQAEGKIEIEARFGTFLVTVDVYACRPKGVA